MEHRDGARWRGPVGHGSALDSGTRAGPGYGVQRRGERGYGPLARARGRHVSVKSRVQRRGTYAAVVQASRERSSG